jgi:hypothetical protein
MNANVYDLTVKQFTTELKALQSILKKANAYADSKKFNFDVLLNSRLAPDQFALLKQVQVVTDNAKGCVARLTGEKPPVFEDNETKLDQLLARIDKTIEFMSKFKPEHFQGYETKRAEFPWYPGKYLEGSDYLVQHAIPNFYFHMTTAYSILRANGVDLGKGDFLGQQNWKSL